MKAIYIESAKQVGIRDIPHPVIREDEVLLRVKYCGICGSDLHVFRGLHAFRKPPVIPGHEVVGEVCQTGSAVKKLQVGDIVAVLPKIMCGHCEMCKRGIPEQCLNKIQPGTEKWIGGFVEYFPVPEAFAYRLPDSLDALTGSLAEPLGVALHAVKRAQTKKSLLILGAGAIGTLAVIAARVLGIEKIAVTDTEKYNLEMAEQLGASAIHATQDDVLGRSKELFGPLGPDAVIITATAPNILDQALDCVCRGGNVVFLPMITAPLTFISLPLMMKQVSIVGSSSFTPEEFDESIRMIAENQELFRRVITRVYPWTMAQEALDSMADRRNPYLKVILDFQEGG